MFEQSVITTANPADFSFKIPALKSSNYRILFDLALSISSFDLYIQTGSSTFKLEYSVVTNLSFDISKNAVLSFSVQGQASKLLRVFQTIPGSDVNSQSIEYCRNLKNTVLVAGGDISRLLSRITVELQNQVSWIPHQTIQESIGIETSSDTTYSSKYSVDKRVLAGNITQYLTDNNNNNLQSWNSNTSLVIKAGEGNFFGFDFNIPKCSFTNRLDVQAVYTQSYDWRMTENPTSLGDVIKYITL